MVAIEARLLHDVAKIYELIVACIGITGNVGVGARVALHAGPELCRRGERVNWGGGPDRYGDRMKRGCPRAMPYSIQMGRLNGSGGTYG